MPEIGTLSESDSLPYTVDWRISNFFQMPKQTGYLVASPVFHFREYNCRLVALPNGTDNLPGIALFTLTGIGRSGTVSWELEIQRVDQTVLRKDSGWKRDGYEEEMNLLIPYKEIERACYVTRMVKVTCTLRSEDDIVREREEERYKERASQTETTARIDKLSHDLQQLLYKEDESNVIIKIRGEELKAHKSILGACSPIFASMFKHKMSENITGIVDIDDCEPNTFREFLHYLYTGTLRNFSPKYLFGLYTVADKYQVNELKSYCLEYIKNNLSVDLFCDVVLLSAQYDEEELMDKTTEFLSKNMTQIMGTEKWQNFLSEYPSESNQLLLEALKLQESNK